MVKKGHEIEYLKFMAADNKILHICVYLVSPFVVVRLSFAQNKSRRS